MGKSIKIYLAIGVGFIILYSLISPSSHKPINWDPTYSLDNKNPLDLYILNREINSLFPGNIVRRVNKNPYEFLKENKEPVNLIIIKKGVYNLQDNGVMDEVAKGAVLFLSAESIATSICDTLGIISQYDEYDWNVYTNSTAELTLTRSDWKNKKKYLTPVRNSTSLVQLNHETTTILGNITKQDSIKSPSFVKIRYGKGIIYLLNQPQVFTNAAFLSPDSTSEYVANVLSYIPRNKPIVWLVEGQCVDPENPKTETPLSAIFKFPSLRAAWLILIYGLLLYVIFHAKRRERVVPIIPPLKNTSIEFIQTISNLYYQEDKTSKIIERKIVFFLDRIRTQYYLDTSKLNDSFALKLSNKSNKDLQLIHKILSIINEFSTERETSKMTLIQFNKLLDEFWSNNEKQ